jgi:hypothetical protein
VLRALAEAGSTADALRCAIAAAVAAVSVH